LSPPLRLLHKDAENTTTQTMKTQTTTTTATQNPVATYFQKHIAWESTAGFPDGGHAQWEDPESGPNGKSWRFVYYPKPGMTWAGSAGNRLSIYGTVQEGRAALHSLKRFRLGQVWGTRDFIGVAPQINAANKYASGVFAYVTEDYRNDLVIQLPPIKLDDGTEWTNVFECKVDPLYLPKPGSQTYRQVVLVGDGKTVQLRPSLLVAKESEDVGLWTNCRVLSALIGGETPVSISVGPLTVDDALAIADIVKEPDLAKATQMAVDLRAAGRISSQLKQGVANTTDQMEFIQKTTGTFVVPAQATIFAVADANGFATDKTVDLADVPPHKKVYAFVDGGIKLKSYDLKTSELMERAALAQNLRVLQVVAVSIS